MTLKPWREIAVPHEDVLKGTFQQAEFAADLSRVHAGTATAEYQNPTLFFQRTFITEGMRLLLDSVVRRLAGKGGDPVIQLQTAFGGGKTHTMLAVYHLACAKVSASDMPGVSAILDAAEVTELPRARIVVLDGVELLGLASKPAQRQKTTVHTLWGELAWQLGGAEAYALVAEADQTRTSPGKSDLSRLLAAHAPCVILIDELVRYVSQFEEGQALSGGSFDANLSFIQALTEALKAVPTAVLLASLPESEKEAGSQRGVKALASLAHYFGRVQALWKPVATEEAFEIVRRRLFTQISDRLAAESVCRAFASQYISCKEDLPSETQKSDYYARLMHAYPIHPEVFDRLFEDWSSLDNFQRTRGVLKLMAQVIYRLWNDGNNDALILPGSLPLYDGNTRNGILYYLPQGWDPVLERDIDGERAETTSIENQDTRLGAVQACRRTARTIFLGSAPTTAGQLVRGLELERVLLGVIQPGQQISVYKDALRRLGDRLHYLNHGNNRYWFDTRPNLRREMEERKGRFQDKEDVFPAVQERVRKSLALGAFGGIHVFTGSSDVPDDWGLRLVVLPPDAGYSRTGTNLAVDRATEILKKRGDAPRQKQNRLIFLAADFNNVARLREQVRSMLAWQSIVNDMQEGKLNLDMVQARQAQKSLDDANGGLRRMIFEIYKWLLAPVQQEVRVGRGLSETQWDAYPLNPSAGNASQEIERVMKENELLITEWAPIHLASMLRMWFWRDGVTDIRAQDVWQKTCQYLYLPRLRDVSVFQATLNSGVEQGDFFGVAQGKDAQRYLGFAVGRRTTVIMDGSLLLIEPSVAVAYADQLCMEAEAARRPMTSPTTIGSTAPSAQECGLLSPSISKFGALEGYTPLLAAAAAPKRRFYGSVDLDPLLAKKQFADLVDEVVLQFTAKPGVKVRIAIEVEAESSVGFDDTLQRAVKENCKVLKFKGAEFEMGD